MMWCCVTCFFVMWFDVWFLWLFVLCCFFGCWLFVCVRFCFGFDLVFLLNFVCFCVVRSICCVWFVIGFVIVSRFSWGVFSEIGWVCVWCDCWNVWCLRSWDVNWMLMVCLFDDRCYQCSRDWNLDSNLNCGWYFYGLSWWWFFLYDLSDISSFGLMFRSTCSYWLFEYGIMMIFDFSCLVSNVVNLEFFQNLIRVCELCVVC